LNQKSLPIYLTVTINESTNYMRYHVGNPDEAEELTSQVFEKVLSKIKTFRQERGTFESWIFAIAYRAVKDHHRRKERRVWCSLESIRDLVSCKPGPEETVLQNEEQNRLIAALNYLAERERNIIAMKFAGGLKNRE